MRYETVAAEIRVRRAHTRLMDLLTLGRIAERRYTRKMLPTPNQTTNRVSPLFYLPEVDPVTMRATGGVKTARLIDG